jgi:hypothetical protein
VTSLLDDLTREFCPFPDSALEIYQKQAKWPEPIRTGSSQLGKFQIKDSVSDPDQHLKYIQLASESGSKSRKSKKS